MQGANISLDQLKRIVDKASELSSMPSPSRKWWPSFPARWYDHYCQRKTMLVMTLKAIEGTGLHDDPNGTRWHRQKWQSLFNMLRKGIGLILLSIVLDIWMPCWLPRKKRHQNPQPTLMKSKTMDLENQEALNCKPLSVNTWIAL